MIVARDNFDAVVLGAGPAGSVAAMQLARGGASVLLVDKAAFPREKVCGCCVNAAAVGMLNALGLGELLPGLNALLTDQFRLCTPGRATTISLPPCFAVSRAAFDGALAEAAQREGVAFLDGTIGSLVNSARPCSVRLRRGAETMIVTAAVVLGCTGLADRSFDEAPGLAPRIARRSHMGCAAITAEGPASYLPGVIYMAHGRGGYVGLNRLEDGRLDVAAALSPKFVQQRGGPGRAVSSVLGGVGLPTLPVDLDWRGTPLLTRSRPSVAATRLFLVGDAAGYVEPFTGEGIAWAIASAQAVAPIALRAIETWDHSLVTAWNTTHRRLFGGRQRNCRWLTRAMRPPLVTRVVNRVLSLAPSLARPFVKAINRPWPALRPIAALPLTAGARP